ncbi:VRR-NUC domain-containing protein [Clostridium sp.]|uniref:VRR-NUC domain-containing protein n=1 Tax=Clostridium sp. TaxID=1506 RepID=UPI00359F8A13
MREKDIEKYLVDKIKNAGGRAYKFISPGNAGVPDRLVLLPEGKIIFVELKAPGKKPTSLQLVQHRRIQNLGFKVLIIDNKQAVDDLIDERR